MKKALSLILVAILVVSMLAVCGCVKKTPSTNTNSNTETNTSTNTTTNTNTNTNTNTDTNTDTSGDVEEKLPGDANDDTSLDNVVEF